MILKIGFCIPNVLSTMVCVNSLAASEASVPGLQILSILKQMNLGEKRRFGAENRCLKTCLFNVCYCVQNQINLNKLATE